MTLIVAYITPAFRTKRVILNNPIYNPDRARSSMYFANPSTTSHEICEPFSAASKMIWIAPYVRVIEVVAG